MIDSILLFRSSAIPIITLDKRGRMNALAACRSCATHHQKVSVLP
jgi:hypothetical protein